MAVEALTATSRANFELTENNRQFTIAQNNGTTVHTATVEVTAAASATSTYHVATLPASARLQPQSVIGYDDLASTGAPTLDVGIFGMTGVTDDDDAINDGLDVATGAVASAPLIKDVADWGKPLWSIMGLTADPGGVCNIKLTLKDAATNTGGTVSTSIVWTEG